MTKLLPTSKSTTIVVFPSAATSIGALKLILIPERLALGNPTLGELVLVSTWPFFSVTLD